MKNILLFTAVVTYCMTFFSCNTTHPDRHHSTPKDENEYYVENSVNITNTTVSFRPYVKMYVENSGSMDGYVNGGSDLRNVVEKYLYELEMSDAKPRTIDCFFINRDIITIGNDIKAFAQKITPLQFKKSGGGRGSTDFAEILKKIIPSDSGISLLVSDFIFSPGKGKDADYYLTSQQSQITRLFHDVSHLGMSVLIYKFDGNFDGYYFDRNDHPTTYQGKRPFFLMAIGKDEFIQQLRLIENNLPVKIQNKCIVTNGIPIVKYAILPSGGDYRVCKGDNHAVEKAHLTKGKGSGRSSKRTLTINIGVDLSNLIANSRYILDTINWQTDNDSYHVVSVTEDGRSNHTHVIKIESTSNNKTNVTIMLKNNMPRWIYRFNDNEGRTANSNDSVQTTYGLEKLVKGIYDAYTSKDDNLCKITISVNK